jgi:hypothetical protein
MIYNIVCTHEFKNLVSKLENYKMDLGTSFTNKSTTVLAGNEHHIKDPFIVRFYDTYNILAYKVGVLGAINFYTTPSITKNQLYVASENRMELIDISPISMQEMISTDILTFLGKVLHDLQS